MGGRALVMGIVNVTPDSFSDGGVHLAREDAVAAGLRMTAEGADILDVGGESTRPGHQPVAAEVEWARIAPVLADLAGRPGGPPISVDTWKAAIARRALEAGAAIVNDVWGLQRDPDMAAVAAESGAGLVLMHNRADVDPSIDILPDILRFLERSLVLARRAGIADGNIVLDPGIGFGKTFAQNHEVLAGLPRLKALGFPLLLGLSRKGFLGALTEPPAPAGERLAGTLAGNVLGVLSGADIVRVHDVAPHIQALRLVERVRIAIP